MLVASGATVRLEDSDNTYVARDMLVPQEPRAPVADPSQVPLTLPSNLFTGAVDEAAGIWEPTPFLRALSPRHADNCWLVDSVTPDELCDARRAEEAGEA